MAAAVRTGDVGCLGTGVGTDRDRERIRAQQPRCTSRDRAKRGRPPRLFTINSAKLGSCDGRTSAPEPRLPLLSGKHEANDLMRPFTAAVGASPIVYEAITRGSAQLGDPASASSAREQEDMAKALLLGLGGELLASPGARPRAVEAALRRHAA
jgi:hypothetical protein